MKSMTNTDAQVTGKLFTARKLTVIGMLSAIAVVLMLVEFPLWFAPSFYKIDLSEVPVLVGAFALGPVAGVMVEMIKIILNFALNGTETAGIGEIANFLIGCAFVLPAAMVYKRKRSRNSALLGMIIGTLTMVILGSAMNAFVLLPVYAKVYGISIEGLVKVGTAINPAISNLTTFVLFAVAPFNIVKGIVVTTLTMLIYGRISPIIRSIVESSWTHKSNH